MISDQNCATRTSITTSVMEDQIQSNRIEDQTRSERDTNVTIAKRIKLKVHETLT